MELRELMAQCYEEDIKRGVLAKTTIQNYHWKGLYFLRWLEQQDEGGTIPTLPDLTKGNMQNYVTFVYNAHPASLRLYTAVVKHFITYLLQEGWIQKDPLADITIPRVRKNRRVPVPEEVLVNMFDAVPRLPGLELRRKTCLCILALLRYGGLRVSEIIRLTPTELRLEGGYLLVQNSKGGKSRRVHLPKEAVAILRDFLKFREDYLANHATKRSRIYGKCESLLVYNVTMAVSIRGVREHLRAVARVAGYEQDIVDLIVPHRVRHSYATAMANAGVPIPVLATFLGHTNEATTWNYIHGDESQQVDWADHAALKKPEEPKAEPPAPPVVELVKAERKPTPKAPTARKRIETRPRPTVQETPALPALPAGMDMAQMFALFGQFLTMMQAQQVQQAPPAPTLRLKKTG